MAAHVSLSSNNASSSNSNGRADGRGRRAVIGALYNSALEMRGQSGAFAEEEYLE